jgi:hypothetical protein
MPQSLYAWGKSLWCLLDRRMSGPQSHSGRVWRRENILPLLGIEPQFLGRPSRGLVVTLSTLSRLNIQRTVVILQLGGHCVYLVFMFLLLVQFCPRLWHITLIMREFEGVKLRISEKHLSVHSKHLA